MTKKKLIFTLLWMVAGLVAAAIISLLIAPLVPRPPADGHTSAVMICIYIGFALMPWVGMGIALSLGLLGKLPGTKKDVST
jgi:hypothetical protein